MKDIYPDPFFSHADGGTSPGTGYVPEEKTNVNLAAGDGGNTITHTLGRKASFIQAFDSAGEPLELNNWKVDPANLTTKIKIYVEVELLGVTLKIF